MVVTVDFTRLYAITNVRKPRRIVRSLAQFSAVAAADQRIANE